MLAYDDLLDICRRLDDERVLTVYLAKEGSDPGQAGLWENRLESALAEERARVAEATPQELDALDAAFARVREKVSSFGRVLPHRGWWAAATAERVQEAGPLPFAPPTLVRWRSGVYAAPLVRALKSERPVAVALLDSRDARLLTYHDGALTPVEELAREGDELDLSDMGVSKRSSSRSIGQRLSPVGGGGAKGHSGVRGETRTDAARRALDDAEKHLRARVVEQLVKRTEPGDTVLVGGSKKQAAALLPELEARLSGRIAALPDVPIDADDGTLLEAVAAAASTATIARQRDLFEQARERGLASVGWNESRRALAAGAVDTLLLSRDLVERAPDDADELVRLALAQRSHVEELGGELGARLRDEGDGVAARLRYRAAT